jgi:hypothetical protein
VRCSTPVFKGGRGDTQMRQKARVLTLIGILTSSAGGQWTSRSDFNYDGRWEGQLMLPDLAGAAQLCASGNPAAGIQNLGMTLIRANTLAFGLIGKDGPHRIIKICFRNMNLVFGSEVALLGFWEYMFGVLITVCVPEN